MKQPIHLSQQNPKMTLTISWKVLMLQGFTAHSLSQWLNKGFSLKAGPYVNLETEVEGASEPL